MKEKRGKKGRRWRERRRNELAICQKKKKKVKELIEENKHTNYRVIRFFYKVY